MNLSRVLRHPMLWLLVQAAVVFSCQQANGALKVTQVPDTPSYLDTARAGSLRAALHSHRTLGYPLFLRSLGLRADGAIEGSHARHAYRILKRATKVQALAFLAAVALFWWSARVFTGSPWLALAIASPLLYMRIWELVGRIQPDFLAAALALTSFALLLLWSRQPSRPWLWAGLIVSVFLTYQVRPAYIFMTLLVPAFGAGLVCYPKRQRASRCIVLTLGLLVASVLPYLLFCSMRWVQVREFNLTSLGGTNLLGVAASFLDRDVVKGLDRNKPLARDILRERRRRKLEPMPIGGDTGAWYAQHVPNVFEIGLPAAYAQVRAARAARGLQDGDLPSLQTEVNHAVAELSLDVIRLRPFHYLQWIRDGMRYRLVQATRERWIRWPGVFLALSLPLALVLGRSGRVRDPATAHRHLALFHLAILAAGYFIAHLLIVVLVIVPYDRFFLAMVLLVPPVLCGCLFELWRGLLTGVRQPVEAPRSPVARGPGLTAS